MKDILDIQFKDTELNDKIQILIDKDDLELVESDNIEMDLLIKQIGNS